MTYLSLQWRCGPTQHAARQLASQGSQQQTQLATQPEPTQPQEATQPQGQQPPTPERDDGTQPRPPSEEGAPAGHLTAAARADRRLAVQEHARKVTH